MQQPETSSQKPLPSGLAPRPEQGVNPLAQKQQEQAQQQRQQ